MNEINDKILSIRIEGSSALQALLNAYKAVLLRKYYAPVELIEKAIYSFRDEEISKIEDLVPNKQRPT